MDMPSLTPYAGPILAVLAAILLLAVGRLLGRKTVPQTIPGNKRGRMQPLLAAAEAAHQAARRERMVIATVAERADGDPTAWFAQSIAGVVAVYRMEGSDAFEKVQGANIGTAPEALYIRRRDFDTYICWARSVQ